MSLSPNTVATPIDLFDGNGTATGTRAGQSKVFPPGKKAIQVGIFTSATLTLKIQNSVDNTTWFDISSSTVASASYLAEVDSVVPYWRVNVTAHTTSGTANNMAAAIAQLF